MNTDMLQKQFNIVRIIWMAMLVSLAIYLVISQLAADAVRQTASDDIPLDLMRRILIGISVAELLFIDFFRKRRLKPQPGASPEAVVQKYSVTSLVSYAIAESIGIFGMVLYFLGDNVIYLYFLIGISALTMLYHRPKLQDLTALVAAAKRGLSQP